MQIDLWRRKRRALLACLLPGLGHLLLREYLLGFGIMAGFLLCLTAALGFLGPLPYLVAYELALSIMASALLDLMRFDLLTGRRAPLRLSQCLLAPALVLGLVGLIQFTIILLWQRVILSQGILQLAPPITATGNQMVFAPGDHLLFTRSSYRLFALRAGDIVLVDTRNLNSVQRILAVPGDFLEVTEGRIYYNGEILPAEAYPLQPVNPIQIYREILRPISWARRLGKDEYAVWGVNLPRDNIAEGPETLPSLSPVVVSRSQIRGKAWLLYYPYEHRRFIRSIGASPTEGE